MLLESLAIAHCWSSGMSQQFAREIPERADSSSVSTPSFLHFCLFSSLIVCPWLERAACRVLTLAFSFAPVSESSGTQSPTSLSLHSEHKAVEEAVVAGGHGGWLGSSSACHSEPVAPSSLLLIEMSSVTKTTWQLGLNGAVKLMLLCFNCFLSTFKPFSPPLKRLGLRRFHNELSGFSQSFQLFDLVSV